MAYITTAEVREIRNALKEEFGPELKFGVKKQHHSSVTVTIKKGNVDFSDIMREGDRGYAQVNHYTLTSMVITPTSLMTLLRSLRRHLVMQKVAGNGLIKVMRWWIISTPLFTSTSK